jgi:hypothetical protein
MTLVGLFKLGLSNMLISECFYDDIQKLKVLQKKTNAILSSRKSLDEKLELIELLPILKDITELQDLLNFTNRSRNGVLAGRFNDELEGFLKKFSKGIPKDTVHNLWIVKPGNLSRGRNIKMFNNLSEIDNYTKVSQFTIIKPKWVIQKYIENPLLITGRKFDIRLYILVTSANPLKIWMYSDYYIRLSPSKYTNLDKDTASIHLTNFSISKYVNVSDDEVYKERMMSRIEFSDFMNSHFGKTAAFTLESKIKNVLKKVFATGSTLISHRPNTFEMLGIDILIDQHLTPWLLEVNASPSMETGTSVTMDIIRRVSEDLVKVIVDEDLGNKNPNKTTIGKFELLVRLPKVEGGDCGSEVSDLIGKGARVKDCSLI